MACVKRVLSHELAFGDAVCGIGRVRGRGKEGAWILG